MQEKIAQAIEEALRGTKRVVVTFQRGAIPHLIYLWKMIVSGRIQVSRDDQENLESIRKNLRWFDDESRKMILILTDRFDRKEFTTHFGRNGVLQEIAAVQ